MKVLPLAAIQYLHVNLESKREDIYAFSEAYEQQFSEFVHHLREGITITYNLEFITKFAIAEYLGEEYYQKLMQLYDKRKDYSVWMVFYDVDIKQAVDLATTKAKIDKLLAMVLFQENCFYQSFYFEWDIKDHYYVGDVLAGRPIPDTQEASSQLIDQLQENGLQDKDFFPTLKTDIEAILKEDFEFDYYAIGDKTFSLYWFISKLGYLEKMQKIKALFEYKELSYLVDFDIHAEGE